jgi:hypothetical protein
VKKQNNISPEIISKEISLEMKKMAVFLGWSYHPFMSSYIKVKIGWYDEAENYVCRVSRDLPFYRNIYHLKKVILKIEEAGYVFLNKFQNLDDLFRSENDDDIILGRGIKNIIWKECIDFLNK